MSFRPLVRSVKVYSASCPCTVIKEKASVNTVKYKCIGKQKCLKYIGLHQYFSSNC